MKIERGFACSPHGKGHIENPRFCFKSHPNACTQESAVQVVLRHVILRPPNVHKGEQKRIETGQIAVFERAHRVLGSEDTLFVESAQELVAPIINRSLR